MDQCDRVRASIKNWGGLYVRGWRGSVSVNGQSHAQSLTMPPNTHGRVQGKHSCEISWVTSQMTNLYWCKRQLLSCQSFKPLSVWLFIWLSVFARGTVAAECSDCIQMKDGSKSRRMTETMTTCMIWKYCIFGLIHPSAFILHLGKLLFWCALLLRRVWNTVGQNSSMWKE